MFGNNLATMGNGRGNMGGDTEDGGVCASLIHQSSAPNGHHQGIPADRVHFRALEQISLFFCEQLGLGTIWKCFLTHSYHPGRLVLKSSMLTGVCAYAAARDKQWSLIKKRTQWQDITSPLVLKSCLTTYLGSAFRRVSQLFLFDCRVILMGTESLEKWSYTKQLPFPRKNPNVKMCPPFCRWILKNTFYLDSTLQFAWDPHVFLLLSPRLPDSSLSGGWCREAQAYLFIWLPDI